MPLDIGINKGNGQMETFVRLGLDEYDAIIEKIKESQDFPILNTTLTDYYGNSEVFLEELGELKNEVLALQNCFNLQDHDSVLNFLDSFYNIIDNARIDRKTIMFLGDLKDFSII